MKNQIGIIIVGIVFIVAVAAGYWNQNRSQAKNEQTATTTSTEQTENEESKEEKTQGSETEESSEKDQENTEAASTQSIPKADNDTVSKQTADEKFPCKIEGTNLIVQKISGYSGEFLEDGSNENIKKVAAILLKNNGSKPVEYAEITIKNGKRTLKFQASDIPSGASVIVQEINKKKYKKNTKYSSCTGIAAEMDSFDKSKDSVKVTQTSDGAFQVTNLTKDEIPCVRLFYKLYDKEKKRYVGGITYTAKLTKLAAGDTIDVTPSHYVKGQTKIMMVRTYDSEE
jgi:cytoskeletal protein RodZ